MDTKPINRLSKTSTFAIIGASANPEKYGYKVLSNLISKGYQVIPINPKGGEILGQTVYPTISTIPETSRPEWVVMIVPPEIGLQVLPEIKVAGYQKIWFQPGSERRDLLDWCQNNKLEAVSDACVMIETDLL